ncbi:MAG TPA: hypothetical protein VKB93_00555 [Thermoanaerobaculia bacterium]|nr:hypothetical protein [Thermoanaerobaculia bacterium]
MNDLVTITVSLEGSFASAETVNVPLDNLAFVGEPWVSSEFAWINGEVVRRKVFRFRARPLLPGMARVGPVALSSGEGQRDTLKQVVLQVEPDRIAATNDPEAVLRELMATGRPPLFLVAETDKRDVWQGQQILVTWYLYNAAAVESWQIVSVPKLADFWSEEIEARASEAERVFVGNQQMQRVRMRRVALYPLRSGTLQIGGMSVEAGVMERLRGPFSTFEGTLVETTFSSAPITINVRPLPPGPPVDAVGELTLACAPAKQRNHGPIVVDATLNGQGDLRGASAPRFARAIAGNVQVEGGTTTTTREETSVSMTRKWGFLIFPEKAGELAIPPLVLATFSPSAASRKTLQCEEQTLWNAAVPAADQAPSRRLGGETPPDRPARTPAFLALAVLIAIFTIPKIRKELALRREVRDIVRSGDVRASVDAKLNVDPAVLLAERSERGDAYRSLRSLLDAMERDRDIGVDTKKEIARRVREVIT